MAVSYRKLFAMLERKHIRKIDLRTTYSINPKTVDRLVKNESVTVDTLEKLCRILNCQIGDLVEYVPDEDV